MPGTPLAKELPGKAKKQKDRISYLPAFLHYTTCYIFVNALSGT
jgi:hypothetical protein